ncbi:MAG TPA: Vms1/Ankzf1 family peptidyl-tRNA hydrolase, partial [Vicinamibacterales bacterium]
MTLTEQLDRLAALEPTGAPVVSLYLNTQPDQHGRDHFQTFVRKELKARMETYPAGQEREGLERDRERIEHYLEHDLQPSANGVCIFACDAAGLFEAIQLDAPIDEHWLSIGNEPHLYPLARTASLFPRYAALLADTNSARILVIADGNVEARSAIAGVKTRRTSQGGWSQARFQRRNENAQLHNVKDVVDALEKIVDRERIDRIVIAGDAVVLPLIREQMPKHLADKVVDEMPIATSAPERDVVQSTLDTMRRADQRSERERVEAVIGAYRAGGLGVVGPDATLLALTNGQVDELLLAATPGALSPLTGGSEAAMAIANDAALAEPVVETAVAGEAERAGAQKARLADELVTKARQTGARV